VTSPRTHETRERVAGPGATRAEGAGRVAGESAREHGGGRACMQHLTRTCMRAGDDDDDDAPSLLRSGSGSVVGMMHGGRSSAASATKADRDDRGPRGWRPGEPDNSRTSCTAGNRPTVVARARNEPFCSRSKF